MRLFLDTNIFILGASIAESPSALILDWLGFDGRERPDGVSVLISAELQDQIRRVARRVGGKNWAGEIIIEHGQQSNLRRLDMTKTTICSPS